MPPDKTSYPLMQLSEVEKCMLAMIDDFELGRMRQWFAEVQRGDFIPQTEEEYRDSKTKVNKP